MSANEFTFTGEQTDPTGLQYLRARYYDPSIGRFWTRDPWPGLAYDPQGQNLYTYAFNNPVKFTDPSGLFVHNTRVGRFVRDRAGDVGGALGDMITGARDFARTPYGAAALCNPLLGFVGCAGVAIANADRIVDIASRFTTPGCLGFALDLGGAAALALGPWGVPVAAGLFGASLVVSAKEGDLMGLGLDTIAELTSPLGFATYSPALQGVAARAGRVAALYSFVSCVGSGF